MKNRNPMVDEYDETVHCEICEMVPACIEVDAETGPIHMIRTCADRQCIADAKARIVLEAAA